MRVFITGALGFIGGALGERLRGEGAEVRGVDVRADPSLGVVAGDVTREGEWQRHVDGCDLVIHTAAVVSNAVDRATTWRVNVLGTRRLADAARDAGAQRLVHFSSVRAFGDEGFPPEVTEEWPVRADGNPYVDTKVASEQVVLQAHAADEVEVTVIRPGDVYGPGSRPWVLLPLEAIRSGSFALPRGGMFSPAYVDNLVDGVLLAARRPEGAGQVFTIADGITVPNEEFFAHHHRMLGRPGPRVVPARLALLAAGATSLAARARGVQTEVNPVTMRYLMRTNGYSIDKARRVLGYEPAIGLDEGMRRTEAWLRAEGLL